MSRQGTRYKRRRRGVNTDASAGLGGSSIHMGENVQEAYRYQETRKFPGGGMTPGWCWVCWCGMDRVQRIGWGSERWVGTLDVRQEWTERDW